MDISFIPKMEDVYHPLVIALEYISCWVVTSQQSLGISDQVANVCNDHGICQFRILECVVLDGGAQINIWSNLLLKHYSIRMHSVTLYHTAANGVIM
jgi:hypothetical protein